MKLIQVQD